MFFIVILILKDYLKATDLMMLALVVLSLVFWFGNRMLGYIHLPEGFHWAMNMGWVFTSIMSVLILLCAFGSLLLNFKIRSKGVI